MIVFRCRKRHQPVLLLDKIQSDGNSQFDWGGKDSPCYARSQGP